MLKSQNFSFQSVCKDLTLIRQRAPLVHNITNYVAMTVTANILLALGASPLMAHAREELPDLSNIAKALVLNIGTIDDTWLSAMQRAQSFAKKNKIPIILDPVGAGASKYRTKSALLLLKNGISILRGNASEIIALANSRAITKGVDASVKSLAAEQAAIDLAKKYSCVVVVSGAIDIIVTSEKKCYINKPPFSLLTKVTAMGCSVTGIVGAFAAVNKDYFSAAIHAMLIMGIAAEKAMKLANGPGSFYEKLLDTLYQLTYKNLNDQIEITVSDCIAKVITITLYPEQVNTSGKTKCDYSLYLIADCALYNPKKLPQLIEIILPYGITCVQLRGKNISKQVLLLTGKRLLKILRPLKIPLIINDSIEVAKELDADGVHLGQADADVKFARRILGSNKIIGLSITNDEEAYYSRELPVDYFGVGPVFSTKTKSDAGVPINLRGLKIIKSIVNQKKIVAIGGINLANISSVLKCGVDGVAIASSILTAPNSVEVTKQIGAIIKCKQQKSMHYHCVLSIAGSDSSGGAGVQADIKTISATGSYAASVITALTAQNTTEVAEILDIPAKFVGAQLDSVLSDINFSAIKIGMLYRSDIIEIVAAKLIKWKVKNIVLDPVMVAKGGDKLITDEALNVLKKKLFSLSDLITPNLREAEVLVGYSIHLPVDMEKSSRELGEKYQTNILIKGGHAENEKCADVLYCYKTKRLHWFSVERIITSNTHGTGCTFAAAIASYLAQGNDIVTAVSKAKNYLTQAITAGCGYFLGHGHGPVDHFFALARCQTQLPFEPDV